MKPVGPEYGVKYTLTGPDGTIAVFNDETDGNFVGIIDPQESSGLDSPDVREDATDRVEDDGGLQGANFHGRRPVVLTGVIRGSTATQRNERSSKLMQAANAMRGNATLAWTPTGGNAVFVTLRKQQPTRITGGWVKKFQIGMVAADPRIYGSTLKTDTKAVNVVSEPENVGNAETPPIIKLTGPQTNPVIKNETTGVEMKLEYTIESGKTVTIDFLNHTILLSTGANLYDKLSFTASTWFNLKADAKTKLKCTTGSMTVEWRDAWV